MPASRNPLASDHDGNHVVELQRYDGRAAARGAPHDSRPIFAPLEMPQPPLTPGIEQLDTPTRYRIACMGLCSLEAVTHPAGKPKVFFLVSASPCLWNEVINLQKPENVSL